jgi:hypothetical protein
MSQLLDCIHVLNVLMSKEYMTLREKLNCMMWLILLLIRVYCLKQV